MSSYLTLAEYYDKLTEDVNYKVRSDYISNFLIRYGVKDGLLLDLACGTGKISIELSKKGYDVIGVDISENMLSKAKENALECEQDILFLCQSMTELDLYGTIKSAVCTLDSINHLECIEDVKTTFDKVSLFMEQDGIFIFDVNTIYKHKEVLGNNTFVYDTEEVYLVWQNEFDQDNNSVDIYLDFFISEDGAYYRESEDFTETAYDVQILSELLESSGFEILGIFDDLSENMYNDKSERIYYVARKK